MSKAAPTKHASASKAVASLANSAARAAAGVPADGGQQVRALSYFDDVPAGHTIWKVEDERFEPHVHNGEFVVVDTMARGIVPGELYLVLMSNGASLWQVSVMKYGRVLCEMGEGDHPHYTLSPLNHGNLARGMLNLSDGPYCPSHLRENLLGRVVGLIDLKDRSEKRADAAALQRAEFRRSRTKKN